MLPASSLWIFWILTRAFNGNSKQKNHELMQYEWAPVKNITSRGIHRDKYERKIFVSLWQRLEMCRIIIGIN